MLRKVPPSVLVLVGDFRKMFICPLLHSNQNEYPIKRIPSLSGINVSETK